MASALVLTHLGPNSHRPWKCEVFSRILNLIGLRWHQLGHEGLRVQMKETVDEDVEMIRRRNSTYTSVKNDKNLSSAP